MRGHPFRILGCPRSGTRTVAGLLSAAGWEVRHERLDPDADGMVTCRIDPGAFRATLHLVRHPLDVLGSWQTLHEEGYAAPDVPGRARRWVSWNLRYEALAQRRFRIEEILRAWPALCAVLGRDAPYPALVPRVGESTHDCPEWGDLEEMEPAARAMGARYGYS